MARESFPPLTPPLRRGLERCTLCAACRSGCPTFDLTLLEGHGGRGRMILIQALVDGSLEGDAQVRESLSSCTRCGWCEVVCPVGVPVVALVEKGLSFLGLGSRPRPLAAGEDQEFLELTARLRQALQCERVLPLPPELKGRAVLHRACVHRFPPRREGEIETLLARLGVDLRNVPAPACCGGFEPFSEQHSDLAGALACSYLEGLEERGIKLLLSTSGRCAAHLGSKSFAGEVLGPKELLRLLSP